MSYAWSVRPTTDTDMTSVIDGRSHAIAATDVDNGIWEGKGHYRAVCGATVVVATLTSAPGPECPSCRQAIDAAQALRAAAVDGRRRRTSRWLPSASWRLRTAGTSR